MTSRLELIRTVQRIIDADGSEEEIDDLINAFLAAVPHPRALDLLGKHDDAETIVDAALSYEPLQLPASWPPPEKK